MILEVATMNIRPGTRAAFESAFVEARKVIMQAEGCGAVELQRSVDTEGRYLVFIEWPSVRHHMEGFRNSSLFQEWRRLIGPHFATPPTVEHFEIVSP
jgi:heme-degrading monooxygenase HmoA